MLQLVSQPELHRLHDSLRALHHRHASNQHPAHQPRHIMAEAAVVEVIVAEVPVAAVAELIVEVAEVAVAGDIVAVAAVAAEVAVVVVVVEGDRMIYSNWKLCRFTDTFIAYEKRRPLGYETASSDI